MKKGKILGFRKKTRIGSPQCQKDYKPVGSRCLFKPAKIKQKYEEELSDDLAKELAEAKDMTDEAAKEAANKDRYYFFIDKPLRWVVANIHQHVSYSMEVVTVAGGKPLCLCMQWMCGAIFSNGYFSRDMVKGTAKAL